MAFVRKKRVGSNTYYYLVESYRTEGKKNPRQNVLLYLGKNPSVEDAEADWSNRAEEHRHLAKEYRRKAREYRRKPGEHDTTANMLLFLAEGSDREADNWDKQVLYLREFRRSRLLRMLVR